MSANWFYAQNGQQKGPVPAAELQAAIARGAVSGADLVWREGLPQWTPAARVPELAAAMPAPPAAVLPVTPAIGYYTPAHHAAYAGFWLRFVAHLLDGLIIGAAMFILQFFLGFLVLITGGLAVPLFILFIPGMFAGPWLYSAFMESSSRQATLGKLALGLCVTNEQGGRISFGQATGRFFAKILSGMIFCIGFMMAGWTQRKQALHDLIAGTLVLQK